MKKARKIILFVLVSPLILCISGVQSTNAYFNDVETSGGNSFTASSLDFSLDSDALFAPEVDPETDALRSVSISNDGSLGFQYTVKTVNPTGDLCASLSLKADLDGSEEYDGPLSGFDGGPFVFGSPEDWDFTVSLTDDDPGLQNETCDFDFEYSGWQTDLAGPPPLGFSDTETIANTVTAGEWEVDSCATDPGDIISTVMTGSSFGVNGHNLIVASGGELKSETSGGSNGFITVSTDCDVTVQNGGKITAVKGDGKGGIMTISTRDFTVDVGGTVSASSTASGKDGGTATVTTTGDFTVNGTFSANGHDDGGIIIVDSNDDISVSGLSLTATGTNKDGGTIILSADNDITVSGLISASAKDQGGTIAVLSGGDLIVPAGGFVLAESTNKKGGTIEAIVDGDGTIAGTVSVDGKDGDGFIIMTIQGNLTESVSGVFSASSTGGNKDGGTIGIKVGGDAIYAGTVRANATNDAKNVALWSEGGTIINGTVSSLGGADAGDTGGVINITVRGTFSGTGTIDADDGSVIERTATNSFAGVTIPAATTESIILNDIVLNEIIPDPTGSDTGNAALPLDGEWIELYNKSGVAVDVNNWVLKDADGNSLTITSAKGDNDSDLSDAGETIVPAGSTLTVYRNGAGGLTLEDAGDTVKLLTDTGVLVDSFTYVVDVGEGNSIARMPDGAGAWVDPEPTPTAPNGSINIEKLRLEFLKHYLSPDTSADNAIVEDSNGPGTGSEVTPVVSEPGLIMSEEETAAVPGLESIPLAENVMVGETQPLQEATVGEAELASVVVVEEEPVMKEPESSPVPEQTLAEESASGPVLKSDSTPSTSGGQASLPQADSISSTQAVSAETKPPEETTADEAAS